MRRSWPDHVAGVVALVVGFMPLSIGAALPSAQRPPGAVRGTAATSRTAVANGVWGTAEEVPGTAALNQDGDAETASVSCASAGNCSAGGYYADASFRQQAFVVSQTGGSWGTAEEVPGTAALNQGGIAGVNSVSCASAGTCAAGGSYADTPSHAQAFVVSETGGTWGDAVEVPGTAALNQGGNAHVSSVSCAPAGDCGAGGSYADSSDHQQAFVVTGTDGTWGSAQTLPGSAVLNQGGGAEVTSLSCVSAGNCGAGGYYTDGSGHVQAFVTSETNGTWRAAEEVPGTAALNAKGAAEVGSVSCASAGNCGAAGFYTARDGGEPFVVTETGGTWGTAEEVPGIVALSPHGGAVLDTVSCASPGNCGAGGGYRDSQDQHEAFVVGEVNGTWNAAEEVPNSQAINKTGAASIDTVSCPTAGNCSAGGYYRGLHGLQLMYAGETGGRWGKARELPGSEVLNSGQSAQFLTVSCATPANCSGGGYYDDGSTGLQAFVVSETHASHGAPPAGPGARGAPVTPAGRQGN
jgi:hypothetical protein